MEELGVDEAVARLLGMTDLFRVTLERRQDRAPGGPTRLQTYLLTTIMRRRSVPLGDLVALLEVSPTTVSQMVGALEDRGWVRRAFDPADRRRHSVELTAAGEEAVEAAHRQRRHRLRTVLERLTGAERADLVRIASRLGTVLMAEASHPDDEPGIEEGEHA